MNKFAGFISEDDSAEGNAFGRAMDKLARKAGCPIFIADHLGKDASRGARGTSTKEQNAYFVWDVGEKARTLDQSRELAITKMKNGPDGIGIRFHMEVAEDVEFLQEGENGSGVERGVANTLVVHWDGTEFLPLGETEGSNLTDNEVIALKHLARLSISSPAPIPAGHAVRPQVWWARLSWGGRRKSRERSGTT